MRWTCGMAVVDKPPYFLESERAKFTIMSLLMHHSEYVDEVIVVDNDPHPKNPLVDLAAKSSGKVGYVAMPRPRGTAAPRNRVFEEASNDHVACLDPHVLLTDGFFGDVEAVYEREGKNCPDLIHGPMLNENGTVHATHMNDQWRDGMWGTWGMAWRVGDGRKFSAVTPDGNKLVYVSLFDYGSQRPLDGGEIRDMGLPYPLDWPGHEQVLLDRGFVRPETPFVIPGHGMGFFACRKDSWLPFHKDCRGFGGEEMTTHERFRRAGAKVWCSPRAGWWHDLWRPDDSRAPYSVSTWDRIRNYVLEFGALGMSLDPVREHFGRRCPQHEWDQIVAGVEWPAGVARPIGSAPAAQTLCAEQPPGRGYVRINGRWERVT